MRVVFLTSILVSLPLLLAQTGAGARREAVGAVMTGSAPSARVADGGLIAFTRYRLQNSPLWSEIWVAKPDGSHALKVSHSAKAVEDDQAHFSPDGRWIVFDRCTQDGPCSIWLVRPNGSGQVQVKIPCPDVTCDDSNAAFAPDGRHLVVQHEWGIIKHGTIPNNDQIEHSAIVETNLDGSHLNILRELDNWHGGFEAPRLTPNGRTLVFRWYTWHPGRASTYALYTAPRLGGAARRITPFGSGGEAISPDGRTLLFSLGSTGELTPGNAVYTVGIDGHQLHRLIPPSSSDYYILGSFSPDGRSIVYADGTPGTFADVITFNLTTGKRVQVTHTRNLDGWPTWGR